MDCFRKIVTYTSLILAIGCAPSIKAPQYRPVIPIGLSFFPEPGPMLYLDYSRGNRSLRIEVRNRLAGQSFALPGRTIFSETGISVPFWTAETNWEFELSPFGENKFLVLDSSNKWWLIKLQNRHCSFTANPQPLIKKEYNLPVDSEVVGLLKNKIVYWYPNSPSNLFIKISNSSAKTVQFPLPKRIYRIDAVQEIENSNDILLRFWCRTGGILPLTPNTPATALIEINKLK